MDEREFRREVRRAVVTVLRAVSCDLPERDFWGEVRRAGLVLIRAIGRRYGFADVRVLR